MFVKRLRVLSVNVMLVPITESDVPVTEKDVLDFDKRGESKIESQSTQ